jgi:N-acyl-D-aspartate/D-glutamate deacylase
MLMSQEMDLIIRGGFVVDGTGAPGYEADVAIKDGRIAAVGKIAASGKEEFDAKGKIVTPGFVDLHTHYDGQVTWDNRLAPSSTHGVTSVLMGNCGVGFAPCRPDEHDQLITLMDGVEDIPHVVLAEGVPWGWETYPEYLNFLADRQYDIDFGALVPHAALRSYAMGERGVNCEPATEADIATMSNLVREAVQAGAFGFGTSRVVFHQTKAGKPIPTLKSSRGELMGMAKAMGSVGRGLIQYVGAVQGAEEFSELRELVRQSGRPLTMPLVPELQDLLGEIGRARADGLNITAQVLPRPIGFLLSHELTLNPFYATAPYQALASLRFEDKIAELRKPEVRAAILKAEFRPLPNSLGTMVAKFERIFPFGDPPNYEPSYANSIAAEAQRRGVGAKELAYDLLLEKGGRNFLYCAASNYESGTLDPHMAALQTDGVVLGLGDGGAHLKTLCDASYTTFMLSHFARDRAAGKLPLEFVVHAMTGATCGVAGFNDRGRIGTDYRADLNVIDFDHLRLSAPRLVNDLPAGGSRLLQRADGYDLTIVNGQITYREGEATGALPGRLVRGAQPAPSTTRH